MSRSNTTRSSGLVTSRGVCCICRSSLRISCMCLALSVSCLVKPDALGMSMLLCVEPMLRSIIGDSGFVVSSIVPSAQALLSFHILTGKMGTRPFGREASSIKKRSEGGSQSQGDVQGPYDETGRGRTQVTDSGYREDG